MNALPDAFEARLVHLGLAREATNREELERDGYVHLAAICIEQAARHAAIEEAGG